jgi:hypothetical protein
LSHSGLDGLLGELSMVVTVAPLSFVQVSAQKQRS